MLNRRKIASGLVLLIVGVVITFVKEDIPPNLLSLMQLLYGAFVLGNTAEHVSNVMTSKKDKDDTKDIK